MRNSPERASATAETAVALPALVFVLAACSWALTLAAGSLRCAEAARAAARAAARGEPHAAIVAAAEHSAGRPVEVTTTRAGDLLTVRVVARAAPRLPVVGRLPAVTLAEQATARAEPAGGDP